MGGEGGEDEKHCKTDKSPKRTTVCENDKCVSRSSQLELKTGDEIISSNGHVTLRVESEDKLVLYCRGKHGVLPVWTTEMEGERKVSINGGKKNIKSVVHNKDALYIRTELYLDDKGQIFLISEEILQQGLLSYKTEGPKVLWSSKTGGICSKSMFR